jgi:hypothetical protein
MFLMDFKSRIKIKLYLRRYIRWEELKDPTLLFI